MCQGTVFLRQQRQVQQHEKRRRVSAGNVSAVLAPYPGADTPKSTTDDLKKLKLITGMSIEISLIFFFFLVLSLYDGIVVLSMIWV